ncbi:MAG: hypothetical protein ACK5UE_02790 [Chitinophagales bacterium]|jgi:hypothetical protein|nr:hypothetical protein [Sphingobacteriales bacterium]
MKNFISFSLLFILSCDLSENTTKPPNDNIDSLFNTIIVKDSSLIQDKETNDSIKLSLENIDFYIHNYHPDTFFHSKNKDTFYLFESLGESILDKLISSNNLHKILAVEQCYITSLIVYNGENYCSLENWKHYYSPFEQIEIRNNHFRSLDYSQNRNSEFPYVTLNEIKQGINEHCGTGDYYISKLKKNPSVNDYPLDVYLSNQIFKITLKSSKTYYIHTTYIPGC